MRHDPADSPCPAPRRRVSFDVIDPLPPSRPRPPLRPRARRRPVPLPVGRIVVGGLLALALVPLLGLGLRAVIWGVLPEVVSLGVPSTLAVPATVAPVWALVLGLITLGERLDSLRQEAPPESRAAAPVRRPRPETRRRGVAPAVLRWMRPGARIVRTPGPVLDPRRRRLAAGASPEA